MMNRTTGLMVACLAVGAALAYAATNFRLRVEVAGTPEVAAQQAAAPSAQMPLPPVRPGEQFSIPMAGGIQQVTGIANVGAIAAADPAAIKIIDITETLSGQDLVWKHEKFPSVRLTGKTPVVANLSSTDEVKVTFGRILSDLKSQGGKVTIGDLDKQLGKFDLGITKTDSTAVSDSVELVRPGPALVGGAAAIQVVNYADSPFSELKPVLSFFQSR